ncbi:hypothetical protein KM043_008225 [Ampulex compressa]|nr:hypothetical protein KM043_008225 [Ampulex compressa]
MAKKKRNETWAENGFEDWGGYMAAKKAKLEDQFREEACNMFKDGSKLFQGIAIFVNGYTDPTSDELRRLMMAHGGVYHHYMRPRITTHIIASNLPYSKIVLYRKSQNPVPICKPEWITDSIKANRVLNFQNYLLYSQCTDVQPQLKFKNLYKQNAVNVQTNANNILQEGNHCLGSNNLSSIKNTDENIISDQNKNSKNNARSTKDSEFLSEFYNHSRLHHIATMGTTFKDYVNELRDKSDGKFPGLTHLKELKNIKQNALLFEDEFGFEEDALDFKEDNRTDINQGPIIMHIDMDCFFVSVGLRNKPELKGLPVAVTHAKGNRQPSNTRSTAENNSDVDEDEYGSLSEIASCSYEARKAGIKNGMFLGQALKMCPGLKTIPYDFEGYKEVSYTLYNTVASYTLNIEAVSCDEMYADCTKILEVSGLTPMEFASIIRDEIKQKTGCPVSTGFGSNKLLSRLATRRAKPDGQYYLDIKDAASYIGPYNVQDLPGVGGTTSHKLKGLNVSTCAELQTISLSVLQKEFGKKTGDLLYNMCRGIDHSKLNLEHVRKSVSAEVNYGIRFKSRDDAVSFLEQLSEETCTRLNKANAKGRCITLKLMVRAKTAPKETAKFMGHGLCDYMTRSKNLIAAVNELAIIKKEVISLWNQMQQIPEDVRGIGIQISRLEILKSKSQANSLMNFVNKSKYQMDHQYNEINKNNAKESSKSLHDTKLATDTNGLKTFSINKATLSTANNDGNRMSSTIVNSEKNATYKTLNNNEYKTNKPSNSTNFEVLGDIDESVLQELPADIRAEIINSMSKPQGPVEAPVEIDSKKSSKHVQMHQENFFKHTKPGTSKAAKAELPSMDQVDMSVLIELPEDIRNEILNEYKANKNEQRRNEHGMKNGPQSVAGKPNNGEHDISFSQVDPDFLAALSEDMRQEVQVYCTAKKKERVYSIQKEAEDKIVPVNKPAKRKDILKHKKADRIPKQKNKASKSATCKTNKQKILPACKTIEPRNKPEKNLDGEQNAHSQFAKRCINEKNINPDIPLDEVESIITHNHNILGGKRDLNKHQEMLINLVNHLFNLPLEQVKMQIQIWIFNSKVVNEVDFLSLATFLSMLPEKKRIEDLHILLKTMHRCMTKTGNCIWHRTYRKTVKHVQHYMQIEYNSNLMVPPIICNLLQCNNDPKLHQKTAKFVGHYLCGYMTKSKNLIVPIDEVAIIKKEVISLWSQVQQTPEGVRGIGI